MKIWVCVGDETAPTGQTPSTNTEQPRAGPLLLYLYRYPSLQNTIRQDSSLPTEPLVPAVGAAPPGWAWGGMRAGPVHLTGALEQDGPGTESQDDLLN